MKPVKELGAPIQASRRTGGKQLFVPATPMLSEILVSADKRLNQTADGRAEPRRHRSRRIPFRAKLRRFGWRFRGMDHVARLVTRKPLLGEPRGEAPYEALINNDNGGPGGCIEVIDYTAFFVGRNQKLSRIVPCGSAADFRTSDWQSPT